jgi:hypothetical protein
VTLVEEKLTLQEGDNDNDIITITITMMVLFEEMERIRRPTMVCCLLLITLLLYETIGVVDALSSSPSSSSSSPKRKTQLLTSSSMKTLPTSLFPKTTTTTTTRTSATSSSKNKTDDKKEKRSTTTTTDKSSSSSSSSSSNVEYYTNYWDNLLLEEYELASNEWKERRKRCSPQTLEKRGLAILQAFAVPDSEILGEKTVRIHSGISNSGSSVDGTILIASNDSDSGSKKDSTSSSQGGGRRRRSSNHHRPWKEIFGKGDVLEMTSAAAATTGGGEFSSSTPLRKECLVIDVYDNNEMIVSVGKSWPYGLWEARKGSKASGFGRTKDKNSQSSYGLPIRIDKTPNGAALVPLRSQRSALQKIRGNKGGSISKWLASSTTNDNKKKRSRRWASQIPYHFRRESLYNDEEMEEQRQLKSSLREATERVISRYDSSSSNSKRRRRRCYLTPNESQKDAITYALSRRVSAIHGPPGTGTYYNSFYRI